MSDVIHHHQFCRITGYGVQPRRGQGAWACISGIAAEAGRLPGACRHVEEVRPPHVLHGVAPVEAGRIAAERADLARDSCGRRLRRDGIVLLAAVVSYPIPRETVEAPEARAERRDYEAWRGQVLAWLGGRFGATLLSVVEHTDEPYLHLHAMIVPDLGPDRRLQLEAIHPGRAALARTRDEGGGKGAQRAAYIDAMRQFQTDFHEAVSANFGHHRHGPRRQRRERPLHLQIRAAEAHAQALEQDLAQRQHALDEDYEARRRTIRAEVAAELEASHASRYSNAVKAVKLLDERRRADNATIAALRAEVEALTARLSDDAPTFR